MASRRLPFQGTIFGQPPGFRQDVFTALTGHTGADVSGKGQDVRGMLLAIGGRSAKTRSGIDLSKAARELGVTRRTVERWVRAADTGTGMRPSRQHTQAMAKKARQAATTQAGRRAALADVRGRKAFQRGARMKVTGSQGPIDKTYHRQRTTILDLSPEDVEAMLDAYERYGEQGFLGWATQHWGDLYVADWQFGQVDQVDLEGPGGR